MYNCKIPALLNTQFKVFISLTIRGISTVRSWLQITLAEKSLYIKGMRKSSESIMTINDTIVTHSQENSCLGAIDIPGGTFIC